MSRIRVGVLRGGPSSEYEVSLKTGASVLSQLREDKYEGIEIFIDRQGVWHIKGKPYDPGRALSHIDVVFNALHGEYGEDGTVQRILESFGVPYTGSNSFSSAVAMNKVRTKDLLSRAGIRVAQGVVLEVTDDLDKVILDLFRTFPQPSVIKPATAGSSLGVTMARSFGEFDSGIREAFSFSPKVLIERYIAGREATVGVIDGFRNADLHALMPIEIIPHESHPFFTYEAKYGGTTNEVCPGNFTSETKKELEAIATKVHSLLGLRHYSRSDFIVSPRGIYFLEVNTLPGLTAESLLPKALHAGGSDMPQFLDHVITLARS